MKIKVHKQLNEELLSDVITIIIPIRIKILDGSSLDEQILEEFSNDISNDMIDFVYSYLNKTLPNYFYENGKIIDKQLNITGFDISEIYINAKPYDSVPIISGTAFFDMSIKGSVDRGLTKQTFNILINNNTIYKEFSLNEHFEEDYTVLAVLEKEGKVEIGDYN